MARSQDAADVRVPRVVLPLGTALAAVSAISGIWLGDTTADHQNLARRRFESGVTVEESGLCEENMTRWAQPTNRIDSTYLTSNSALCRSPRYANAKRHPSH